MPRPRRQQAAEWTAKRLRSGDLIHQVQVQQPADSRDTYGDAAPTWTTVATVWASVESLTGRELWIAQQVQADVTHRVRMRPGAVPGIGPAWSILFGARRLAILGVVDPVQQGEQVELLCVEAV